MPVPQTPSSDSDSDEPNWGDSSHSSADDSDSYSDSKSEFEDVAIDHRRAIRLWTAIHGSHRNATGRMSALRWSDWNRPNWARQSRSRTKGFGARACAAFSSESGVETVHPELCWLVRMLDRFDRPSDLQEV
ncbi:BZ3500_MvSof-1268-A1-R1_Chr4-2g07189 [Microbotryum saponariae]|uniref:BZ3500_MvSof-1268-A1-R1_Chr4-2g07189 protein n=1 Tax=Microbotryum saponariae TaxID=289078 RepID=A0A2X0LIE8_9BASI|nr:BZ3500_MvSof-1268-A1-R1_Chr4-2g07189 [Microbotryum saponariae]SDA06854.1 BZ3501_MvSof-1269-A2-R1_Chr4-2g06900 [Microbotryum saponariae]